jgi:hypothetical protein
MNNIMNRKIKSMDKNIKHARMKLWMQATERVDARDYAGLNEILDRILILDRFEGLDIPPDVLLAIASQPSKKFDLQ